MRKMLLLALMSPFMTVLSRPAVAAEPTVTPFTAKPWDQTPEWDEIQEGTATVALVMGRDTSTDRAAEQSALRVLEGFSFVETDGRMFFGNDYASRDNIDSFIDSLPYSRNLILYYEGPGEGHEEGDPVLELKDKIYRVAALKKHLAERSDNVVIIMSITTPDGPVANDFVNQGATINGAFISPTPACTDFPSKLNNAFYVANSTGKDITIGDLVTHIGCGADVVRYTGETSATTVLFPGTGIKRTVEGSTQSNPIATKSTLPTTVGKTTPPSSEKPIKVKAMPSPFMQAFTRELPKTIPGAALTLGAGVAALIANAECSNYADGEWARHEFATWNDYDAAATAAIPACNGVMVGAGIGGAVGVGFLGWSGVNIAATIKRDAADVRLTVPW